MNTNLFFGAEIFWVERYFLPGARAEKKSGAGATEKLLGSATLLSLIGMFYLQESLPMSLPENIKGLSSVMGRSSTNILLASISTALHLDRAPVTGQVTIAAPQHRPAPG